MLGRLHLRKGDKAEACLWLDRALELLGRGVALDRAAQEAADEARKARLAELEAGLRQTIEANPEARYERHLLAVLLFRVAQSDPFASREGCLEALRLWQAAVPNGDEVEADGPAATWLTSARCLRNSNASAAASCDSTAASSRACDRSRRSRSRAPASVS